MAAEYILILDKLDNVLAVPVPKGFDVGVYRDKLEDILGVETRGVASHTGYRELELLVKEGKV